MLSDYDSLRASGMTHEEATDALLSDSALAHEETQALAFTRGLAVGDRVIIDGQTTGIVSRIGSGWLDIVGTGEYEGELHTAPVDRVASVLAQRGLTVDRESGAER